MIAQSLQFTRDVLDQFLRNRFDLDESKVIMNNLIESNGSIPQSNQNKVVLSVINIEQETLKAYYGRNKMLAGGNYADRSPSERFNIDLLICANFDDYAETLRFLDAVILFFQVHSYLDANAFSTIPPGLTRLEFDIEKINYVQMQGLWTAMGAKYLPSVLYQMRLMTYQGNQPDQIMPAISQTSNLVTA
jgi:hypothetical protein